MAAPVPTYRTAIPQSTPLAHAAAAVCATDAPAIQAGSPRSIMDLILQDFEIERRKLLQQENGFPIPAEARPTATEMLDSELRRHKLRTEHIAVEDRMPPWAEQFMASMNTRFDAVDARFAALQVSVDSINRDIATLNKGAEDTLACFQGNQDTINLIFQNLIAADAPITVMQQTLADIRVAIVQLQQGQTAMARYQTVVDNAIDNIDN